MIILFCWLTWSSRFFLMLIAPIILKDFFSPFSSSKSKIFLLRRKHFFRDKIVSRPNFFSSNFFFFIFQIFNVTHIFFLAQKEDISIAFLIRCDTENVSREIFKLKIKTCGALIKLFSRMFYIRTSTIVIMSCCVVRFLIFYNIIDIKVRTSLLTFDSRGGMVQ